MSTRRFRVGDRVKSDYVPVGGEGPVATVTKLRDGDYELYSQRWADAGFGHHGESGASGDHGYWFVADDELTLVSEAPVSEALTLAPGTVTLRDLFAMSALQGALASGITAHSDVDADTRRLVADCAYLYADAMLAARDAKTGGAK